MQRKIIRKGNLLLREWLKSVGWRQKDLAHELATTYPMINRWIMGYNCPRLETALIIEDLTKGYVPTESWAPNLRNKTGSYAATRTRLRSSMHLVEKKKNQKKKRNEKSTH